jgi:hypothetical protein
MDERFRGFHPGKNHASIVNKWQWTRNPRANRSNNLRKERATCTEVVKLMPEESKETNKEFDFYGRVNWMSAKRERVFRGIQTTKIDAAIVHSAKAGE